MAKQKGEKRGEKRDFHRFRLGRNLLEATFAASFFGLPGYSTGEKEAVRSMSSLTVRVRVEVVMPSLQLLNW